MALRVVWVTPFLPARGVSGTHAYLWALLERMSRRMAIRLVALTDPDETASPDDLPRGLADVRLVRKLPWAGGDELLLRPRAVRWGFTHPAVREAVAAELVRADHDLVRWDYTELGDFVPLSRAPSVLAVHQLWFAAAGPEWRAGGGGFARGAVALHRHLRDLDFELRAVRRARHVIALTREDAARLRRFAPALRVSVVPAGIDLDHFRPLAPAPPVVADVVFVGHYKHYANVDAARFLVREILPLLGRPVRVRLVGTAVSDEVRALRGDGVTIDSDVSDMRAALASAAVVVAPVRFGTGMRVKVLEALAMARPVVATTLAAEGLEAVPGEHLLVADGAEALATAVGRLLADAGEAARLGRAGRAFAERRFGWDAVAAATEAVYDEVLQSGGAPAPPADARVPTWARLAARGGRPTAIAGGSLLLALRGLRWYLGSRS